MPLVHYPIHASFDDWTVNWTCLESRAAQGKPIEPGEFNELRGRHVFTYAGPCCFYRANCVGDAAIYFAPAAEVGQQGRASPFDSGALEDPPKLRPWIGEALAKRWEIFQRYSVPLAGWRDQFERWLRASYDNPDRYLETSRDRHAAGIPDRLEPPEILEHNGTNGYARYGDSCADRRAWTWEVRIADRLPFTWIRALHVPARRLRRAREVALTLRWSSGFVPEVKLLPAGVEATPDTLYADSERVLRELVE